MILTMAYLLVVAVLLGFAAHVGERICPELGWPRRSVWLLALGGSIAVPALTLFDAAAPTAATPLLSLPPLLDQLPAFNAAAGVATGDGATGSSFNWPDWQIFDSALAVVWAVSSAILLLFFAVAAWRVSAIAKRADSLTIGDQKVLVTDRLGPAVLSFLRPRIVLPRWLAHQNTPLRTQVLAHEREHIAARDPLALLAALLLVVLMPWNIALWWQLRRLRAAIEVDCDSRVLRAGANARDYSEALLIVSQRSRHTPFAAVALTEPVGELEKRIRIMLTRARSIGFAALGVRSSLLVVVVAVACAVNAPNAQNAQQAAPFVPTLRFFIGELFNEAQLCLDEADTICARQKIDEIAAIPDLNTYESASLQNFIAYFSFEVDDMTAAMTAYEQILALPRDEMSRNLYQTAMRNLAVVYLQAGRLQEGLDLYDRWLALPYIDALAADLFLRASALYQLENYDAALVQAEEAVRAFDSPPRHAYELLFALQSDLGDAAAAAETLEILNTRWPDESRANDEEFNQYATGAFGFGVRDVNREYARIITIQPVYPQSAIDRRIEGYAVVNYTITSTGETENVVIVESSDTVFDRPAIEAAQKYRYQPRIVDGTPAATEGVISRIEFELDDED
jgi:TonB family protein